MRILFALALLLVVTRCARADDGWVLEFGPYVGYFDFDGVTEYEDKGMFGARGTIHLSDTFRLEAEFDEVYTSRRPLDSRARQVTLAMHGRYEPLAGRFSPSALAGLAIVALDDSENPDAYGEAYDLGLGLRLRATERWNVRAEWLLRAQPMRLIMPSEEGAENPISSEDLTLWGRYFRVGVFYEF